MKILLATDADGHYRTALALLFRLAFRDPELTLLHVDENASFPVVLPHLPVFSGSAKAVEGHAADRRVLERAREEAKAVGFESEGMYECGRPIDQILLQSRQLPADLIAIGSRNRGPLKATLLGSVGHGLALEATQSFLVSHGDVAPSGRLRCIFATDFSYFSELSLERLLSWQPGGIDEITLFTAVDPEGGQHQPGESGTVNGAPVDPSVLASKTTKFERKIEQAGIKATARFGEGKPAESIDRLMKETRADILILGARGHGFMERMLLGSVANAVVSSARYPVLVVRP